MSSRLLAHGARRKSRNRTLTNGRGVCWCFFSSASYKISAHKRTNLIFGANTDVGKTIVTAGLVRSSLERDRAVHYIKPLQCGGSDQDFVERHVAGKKEKKHGQDNNKLKAHTLFRWEMPVSPHIACIRQNKPCSDQEVLTTLRTALSEISHSEVASSSMTTATYIETAGGVLSPSASSPKNAAPRHAKTVNRSDDSNWGWITQGDLYQPLVGYSPVVLVGDGRLGGISCTLSALESLIVRGYDVAALILLETEHSYGNISALHEYVSSRTFRLRSGSGEELFPVPSQSMLALPPIPVDPAEPLHDWYASEQVQQTFSRLDAYLQNSWEGQVSDLRGMLKDGEGSGSAVWWPSAMHPESDCDISLIDSASGDDFHIITAAMHASTKSSSLEQKSAFDASASWFTHGVGHGESSMALAAAAASGRYGHVSAPSGVIHAPAVALAQTLVAQSGWAQRVFFTDDGGSSATEVAIKMGIRTYQKRMGVSSTEAERIGWIVSAQEDCYHGDTLGALDVAEPYLDREHPWYQQKSLCLQPPTIGFKDGLLKITLAEDMEPAEDVAYEFDSIRRVMDIDARSLTKLISLYKEMIEMQWLVHEHKTQLKIGSVIIEPLLQCTGGMKFIDPLWQRAMMEVAESRNIPIILDESSTGLYRLGYQSSREILKKNPDIAIYSKLLTGGLVPFCATLAKEEVFQACADAKDGQMFLNGNTFVANPVGCVSALHALASYKTFIEQNKTTSSGPALLFDEECVKALSRFPWIEQSFTLGTVVAIAVKPDTVDSAPNKSGPSRAERIVNEMRNQGIHAHSLLDVIYIMASPFTTTSECADMAEKLYKTVQKLSDA